MGGNSKTLLISIILTAFAVLLIYTYVQQKDAQLTADLGVMVDVLVANRNIPENTNFEETMVSKDVKLSAVTLFFIEIFSGIFPR